MLSPCVNPQCPTVIQSYGLCGRCIKQLTYRLIPTCGFIPSPALSAIANELLKDAKPTKGELKAAVRIMRGSRHREGDWKARPEYSAAVLHAVPVAPMKRRLPELLVGRRSAPPPQTIACAYVHYHLGLNVLGLDHNVGLYLAGASLYQRRTAIRPKGVRRVYRGRIVRNTYRLKYSEYVAIGRMCLKSAQIMGVDNQYRPAQITTRYLSGVQSGEFKRPIVVHPCCGLTSSAGDHPLDHFLARQDFAPNLPRFSSKIRRASGKIAGSTTYPEGLDVSLEEIQENLKAAREAHADLFRVETTDIQPSTDWLFN